MHGTVDDFDTVSPALESVLGRFRTMVRGVGARHRLPEDDLEALGSRRRGRSGIPSCTYMHVHTGLTPATSSSPPKVFT